MIAAIPPTILAARLTGASSCYVQRTGLLPRMWKAMGENIQDFWGVVKQVDSPFWRVYIAISRLYHEGCGGGRGRDAPRRGEDQILSRGLRRASPLLL